MYDLLADHTTQNA